MIDTEIKRRKAICEDAISRQAVLDIAKSSKSNWIDNSVLFKRVNELPSAKPQEPKTGHWIKLFLTDTSNIDGQCSECGFIHKFIDGHTAQYNYCPNCGAKMVEPQERCDKE